MWKEPCLSIEKKGKGSKFRRYNEAKKSTHDGDLTES